MTGAALQSHYAAVRARLRNPIRRGRDTEIDLGRQSAAAREARLRIVAWERAEAAEMMPPARAPTNKRNLIAYPAPPTPPCFDVSRVSEESDFIVRINRPGRVFKIQGATAEAYGIGRIELVSRRRTGHFILPRQIAMYLCTALTPRSLPEIGRLFGRDHTTIMHARDKIAKLRKTDPNLNSEIEALIARLGMSEAA